MSSIHREQRIRLPIHLLRSQITALPGLDGLQAASARRRDQQQAQNAHDGRGNLFHGDGSFNKVSMLDASVRKSRSEEHTSELQSLMRISYAVFCLKKKKSISQHSK